MAKLAMFTAMCPAQKKAGFYLINEWITGVILSLPKCDIPLEIVTEWPHGRDIYRWIQALGI